uniref:Uncharacterized protein n=1 Tax=Anguilla anguilla TaxID=7936 RepID=A0A0E9RV64_ANGAN
MKTTPEKKVLNLNSFCKFRFQETSKHISSKKIINNHRIFTTIIQFL